MNNNQLSLLFVLRILYMLDEEEIRLFAFSDNFIKI
jgi:hypothetical protein